MSTLRRRLPALAAGVGLLFGFAPGATAQYNPFRTDIIGDALRAGRGEFYFIGQYWSADDSTIENVTLPITAPPNPVFATGDVTMSFDDAFLWGFGLGYNLNTHFTVRGEFTFGTPDYSMTFTNLTGHGEAWVHSGKFNLDYNIIRGPITPFVSGGIGYFFIDSGIPSGPTEYWCWWDAWWGYVCSGYTPTHTDTWFSANATAGLRWDITDNFYLRVSAGANWLAADPEWITAVEGLVSVGMKF